MDFHNPSLKRVMAVASQDKRGTFAGFHPHNDLEHQRDRARSRDRATSPPTEMSAELDDMVPKVRSIFENAMLEEALESQRRAEIDLTAEADPSQYPEHPDISNEVAENQDVPVGPNTPTDEQAEAVEDIPPLSSPVDAPAEAFAANPTESGVPDPTEENTTMENITMENVTMEPAEVAAGNTAGNTAFTTAATMEGLADGTASPPSVTDPQVKSQIEWLGHCGSAVHSTVAAFVNTAAAASTDLMCNPFAQLTLYQNTTQPVQQPSSSPPSSGQKRTTPFVPYKYSNKKRRNTRRK